MAKKDDKKDKRYLDACRGENCYLRLPGVCTNNPETVVPAHANWSEYGKGKGTKAHDRFTVPACFHCHSELDQGRLFTREQKKSFWETAYGQWKEVRQKKSPALTEDCVLDFKERQS